ADRRPGARLRGFDVAIARWSGRDQGVEQLMGCARHPVHGAGERDFVRPRRLREAAQLADELEGRRADLRVRRRRPEIVERLDVATHDKLLVAANNIACPTCGATARRRCPEPLFTPEAGVATAARRRVGPCFRNPGGCIYAPMRFTTTLLVMYGAFA